MVVQNISANGKETDLTFTIKKDDLNKTKKIIQQNKNIITVLYQMLNELYTGIGYYIEIAAVVCVKIAQSYGHAGNIDSGTYIQS